jgi:hypothetical protein
LATVEVRYTSDPDALEGLPATLWNPTDSATINAKYVYTNFTNYFTRSRVEGLRGYRAVNSGGSGTVSAGDYNTSVLGDRLPNSSTWAIALTGGPPDPGGNTYVIGKPRLEPVFAHRDGTQWFRKTTIVATIPAQDALPV